MYPDEMMGVDLNLYMIIVSIFMISIFFIFLLILLYFLIKRIPNNVSKHDLDENMINKVNFANINSNLDRKKNCPNCGIELSSSEIEYCPLCGFKNID